MTSNEASREQADIDSMIAEAYERGKDEPRPVTAVAVSFDIPLRLLLITLSNQRRLSIPQEDIEFVADLSPEQAAKVSTVMLGRGIAWEEIDTHYSLEGLMTGQTGTAGWMQRLQNQRSGRDLAA